MKRTKLVLATILVLMLSFATTAFAGFEAVNSADVYPQTETIYIDNNPVEIDTININGSKYIPLRKVSEALGCTVDYKEDCITVIKDQGYQTTQEQCAEGNQAGTQVIRLQFMSKTAAEFPGKTRRSSYGSIDDIAIDRYASDTGMTNSSQFTPVLMDNIAYVPLRFLCQNGLNCKVEFVNDTTHITSQPLQQFATE